MQEEKTLQGRGDEEVILQLCCSKLQKSVTDSSVRLSLSGPVILCHLLCNRVADGGQLLSLPSLEACCVHC